MPIIKPFRGILYNKNKTGDIASVAAPPYDVISAKKQDELYRASSYNIVRLILGRRFQQDSLQANRYTRSRDFLAEWLAKGVLIQDAEPALYIYEQYYRENSAKKSRLGFIALMRLEGFSKDGILPHENTFKAPKEDRFNLICETKANLCPIFSLYQDSRRVIKKILLSECKNLKPVIDVSSDGSRHRLWRLTDKKVIGKIQRAMAAKTAFLADGHHRYEVALQFKAKMRKASNGAAGPYDYVMMYFADMDPKALTILAAHRMIKGIGPFKVEDMIDKLKRHFIVRRLNSKSDLTGWLKASRDASRQFGVYADKEAFVIKLKNHASLAEIEPRVRSREWKALDVSILHQLILKKILNISDSEGSVAYTRDPKEAVQEVDNGNYKLAFLLKPTRISQVESIARNKELMPHKSTYFYPKPLSGLVINKL